MLANSTWFSATAVVPALRQDWELSAAGAAWLVVAVQAGFIAGSVAAAVMNLPDRIELRRLIAGSAIAAAAGNVALVPAGGFAAALPSRFLVGVALAGVYAPAYGWSRRTTNAGAAWRRASSSARSPWAPRRRISCAAWATSRGRRRSWRPPRSRCSPRWRSAR